MSSCNEPRETPEVLCRIWAEYKKRIKPLLAKIKDITKKYSEQEILLQDLEKLITNITNQDTDNMTTLMNSPKKNDSSGTESFLAAETSSRTLKLTKPVKEPYWTKDMSLETYVKQISTGTDLNEDVPEYVKYHDLIEELKRNTAIKGIQKYVTDHILPTNDPEDRPDLGESCPTS